MAGENKTRNDYYEALGVKKECSLLELKNAYKKLALKWHPDRVSGSGNSRCVEEAKKKFQAIQQAYSVLCDGKRRFLYDVGLYDSDDEDDEIGMSEFLDELTTMMNQTESNENESLEELQQLLDEIMEAAASLNPHSKLK